MNLSTVYKRNIAGFRAGWRRYAILGAILIATLMAIKTSYGILQRQPPDFSALEAGEQRKSAFFEFLLPRINERNSEILGTRRELQSMRDTADSLSYWQLRKINKIASRYEVDAFDEGEPSDWDLLLRRVDVVPPSLALAQAANESAWGTSRFAREGRNYFGHWCYQEGCGIVPRQRPEQASYEVADFVSAQESVDRYIHNLNYNPAYKELRLIREDLRDDDEAVSGQALAQGLQRYSERGQQYVKMIQDIIKFNDLENLDPQV